MIKRDISAKIMELAKQFPVIAITGPRQSGKTTLARYLFADYTYVNLEEPDTRLFARNDPRAFLSSHSNGLIIDEIQHAPDLFSYIQSFADTNKKMGEFVVTGSQHLLLQNRISQSLAGRVANFSLLPLSISELKRADLLEKDYSSHIWRGFYPSIYDRQIEPANWFANYVATYVERDVRQIQSIQDLNTFSSFLHLCAARVGQLLNYTSLANDAGVAVNTVRNWISILEASFIIFQLRPHFQNFRKRLTKMPKFYFYDTGLAAWLLGLREQAHLSAHPLRGNLFENMVISELFKSELNRGMRPAVYFWRDKTGNEIDAIIDRGQQLHAVEIKSGKTIVPAFMKNINYWQKLSEQKNAFLIYGGDESQNRSNVKIRPWYQLDDLTNL